VLGTYTEIQGCNAAEQKARCALPLCVGLVVAFSVTLTTTTTTTTTTTEKLNYQCTPM